MAGTCLVMIAHPELTSQNGPLASQGGCLPVHYFYTKYPDFSPSFGLPWRSPPEQTKINASPFTIEHTT